MKKLLINKLQNDLLLKQLKTEKKRAELINKNEKKGDKTICK